MIDLRKAGDRYSLYFIAESVLLTCIAFTLLQKVFCLFLTAHRRDLETPGLSYARENQAVAFTEAIGQKMQQMGILSKDSYGKLSVLSLPVLLPCK